MLVEPESRTTAVASHVASTSGEDGGDRNKRIREALLARRTELLGERAGTLTELGFHGGGDAGEDAADLGSRALAREHELALLSAIQTRLDQVDRALERLASGRYGWCEWCSEEIPVARLAAFPAATQCVRCKQLEERR
ncbi:MAG: TraR/DksA family transcriptional regulator [Micromonosporaceae bacterium]|nr:TraR/DksA family transcriptional regulator [Micromonosporaceae bacterium]